MQDLVTKVAHFESEFNYYWRFFNGFDGEFDGIQIDDNPNDGS